MGMKKYVKPSLKELGLLRTVTKLSTCPDDEVRFEGACVLPPCWIAAVVFAEDLVPGPRVRHERA